MLSAAGSSEVSGQNESGRSAIRRSNQAIDKLVTTPHEGITTIHDVLSYAARTFPNKKAMGWRDVEKVIEEEKEVSKTVAGKQVKETKTWKYFQLSEYKFLTFKEFFDKTEYAARGLNLLGLKKGQVMNIYAATSVNWRLLAHAGAVLGGVIATAYETLGEEGLSHSLNEPECVGVFTNAALLPTLIKVLPQSPSVKWLVYDNEKDAKSSVLESIQSARSDLKILTIDELVQLGKSEEGAKLDLASFAPKTEDLACIMYTSGTTGAPKGVMLTHANLISGVAAVQLHLGRHLKADDYFLAFLPLAHILEYMVELTLFFKGMTTGYGTVKTLSDASVRNCKGDIAEFKPTLLIGVPAVWELLRKGVLGKIASASPVVQTLFNVGLMIKKNKIPVLSQIADAVVFSKIKASTGGRLRMALCGGAALSKETQEFMTCTMVETLQGYGMTETCGMCAVLTPDLFSYGPVGAPVPSMEVRLVDVPEAGYLTSGSPQRGEVWVRGPSLTQGYFKRPDLNEDKEIFPGDGWFRTGDVGQWNADGTLSIIDRIKNLVKLQGGEYIALERLEASYKSCDLVGNMCVHAVPDAKLPMALIFPHEVNLRRTLVSNGTYSQSQVDGMDLHALCADKKASALVLKESNAVGKKAGFKGIEMLEAVVLTPEEWTPESGLVTAAQKVQRKKVTSKYEKEIKEAYSSA